MRVHVFLCAFPYVHFNYAFVSCESDLAGWKPDLISYCSIRVMTVSMESISYINIGVWKILVHRSL